MKIPFWFPWKTALALCFFSLAVPMSLAQEEESRFRVLELKGMVTAYHDQNDETARLYQNQTLDDGDKATTGPQSEVVLRFKDRVYLYLAPRTKIHITRLRMGDKGLRCQINLITGRMLCQLDQTNPWSLEVSAGSVLCREHGTLFEVSRNGEVLNIVSYEGAAVAEFHGQTKIAKSNEVLKLERGKFRYRNHHLKTEEQEHLQSWRDLLSKIQGKTTTPEP